MLTAERINALKMLAEESSCTIITTFDGLMNPMPMPEKFIREVKKVSVGDILNLEELTKHLVELGYEKNYQAETMGEFSVRGGILDIFPLTEDNPFRIEFWGMRLIPSVLLMRKASARLKIWRRFRSILPASLF